jgi:hypothetical protein
VKLAAVDQQRPDDPRVRVRERDHRDICVSPLQQAIQPPVLALVAFGNLQQRTRAMNQ